VRDCRVGRTCGWPSGGSIRSLRKNSSRGLSESPKDDMMGRCSHANMHQRMNESPDGGPRCHIRSASWMMMMMRMISVHCIRGETVHRYYEACGLHQRKIQSSKRVLT